MSKQVMWGDRSRVGRGPWPEVHIRGRASLRGLAITTFITASVLFGISDVAGQETARRTIDIPCVGLDFAQFHAAATEGAERVGHQPPALGELVRAFRILAREQERVPTAHGPMFMYSRIPRVGLTVTYVNGFLYSCRD